MKIKEYAIILIIIGIFSFFTTGIRNESVENLMILSGAGFDCKKVQGNLIKYNIPVSAYIFEQNDKVSSKVFSGESINVANSRENRQTKIDREYLIGLEKTYIFSEENARNGIKNIIDILFINPTINDTGYALVCKGDSERILNYKVEGYPSSGDYIEGMVKNLKEFNFFHDDYKLNDIYIQNYSYGRRVDLPYLELNNKGLEITGLAIFDKDKMVLKLNMDDSKILNMLRNNNTQGILTIQKNNDEYINYNAKLKKKVKCQKINDHYNLVIDLNFEGNIVTNELYENLYKDQDQMDKFKQDMKNVVEKQCNEFIEKMQKDYKIDLIELGRYAAAKYGRNSNVDWNQEITKAKITVNANVKVKNLGKGDY